MKTRILLAALLIVGTVFLRGDGCITKDKETDLIGYIELFRDYPEDRDTANWSSPKDISFDIDVEQELKDAGYSRDDVVEAKFVVAHYGAVNNESAHDWIVSGAIDIERKDEASGVVEAISYSQQSIDAVVGKKVKADVSPDAITMMNLAIEDYLAGQDGVILTFSLRSETAVGPGGETPSPTDRMTFLWKAWIEFYVRVTEETEWPDPF